MREIIIHEGQSKLNLGDTLTKIALTFDDGVSIYDKVSEFLNEYGSLYKDGESIELEYINGELKVYKKPRYQVTLEVKTMVVVEVDSLDDVDQFVSDCQYSFPSTDSADVVETHITETETLSTSRI